MAAWLHRTGVCARVLIPLVAVGMFVLARSDPSSAGPPTATASPSCVARDLGTLGGAHGNAVAVSTNGLVVGIADDAAGVSRPVLWRNGRAERIATGLDDSAPRGVNQRGVVVGVGIDPSTGSSVGWYWAHGTTGLLPSLGDRSAVPAAISDDGHVVGALVEDDQLEDQDRTPGRDEAEVAARWATPTSTPQVLAPLPGDEASHAYAINDHGLAGGVSEGSGFTAVVWDIGGAPRALPSLGGTWAIVRGLSDAGVAVGDASLADGADHALVWDAAGTPRDLGGAGGGTESSAVGVLDNGAAAGRAAVPASGAGAWTRAALWTNANAALVLPTLTRGGVHDPAAAVTGAAGGRAVGYSEDRVGNRRPVEWQCSG